MALDTRNKRASLLGWGEAWNVMLPSPDGTLDRYDRLQLLGGPSAILPSPGVNTRNKRASLIGMGEPWNILLPSADGSLGTAADRRQLLGLYRREDLGTQIQSVALMVTAGAAAFTTSIPLAAAAVVENTATGRLFLVFDSSALVRALAQAGLTTGIPLVSAAQVRASAAASFASTLSVGAVPQIEFVEGAATDVDLSGYAIGAVAMLFEWGFGGAIPGVAFNPSTRRLGYDGRSYGLADGAEIWRDGNHIAVTDGADGIGGVAFAHPGATATLGADTALAAAAQARTTATVALATQIRPSAAALARASAAGELSGAADLRADAQARTQISAALATSLPLAGQAYVTAAGTGALGAPAALQGSATIVTEAHGALTSLTTFSAAALDNVLASGNLTVEINLGGEVELETRVTATFAAVLHGNFRTFRAGQRGRWRATL